MKLDAVAFESQFLDHLAPVWKALPATVRGAFRVHPTLTERARSKGIDAVPTPLPDWTAQTPPRFDGKPALVASYGDTKVARRLGYGPFAYLEHGAGQSYSIGRGAETQGSYAGGPDRDDTELFLAPNEQCADRWKARYPATRVEVVGCPKLDDLPARVPGAGPVVALSFHWPAPLSISGYAGTAVGDYLSAFPALVKRFDVIGHAHPKTDWPARMKRTYDRFGIPFITEFEDVCRQADVYVCDNSSTIFEFAATGRPVVLLNARHWSRKGSVGLRFWDAAHVGINVDRAEDLVGAIEEALADWASQKSAREDALSLVYPIRTGGAQLAATAILGWLGARSAVAA